MAKNRFSILANLDSSDLDDDLQRDTTNQFEEADSADSQPEEESKRRRSDSAKSTAAPSVRYLEKVAEFADMNERDIPNLLIRETVREGLVTDHNRKNSRTLHLSDNIIVISKFKGKVESFRNPLVGVWRGDQSATPDADVKTLDTSYFFFQVMPTLEISMSDPTHQKNFDRMESSAFSGASRIKKKALLSSALASNILEIRIMSATSRWCRSAPAHLNQQRSRLAE